MNCGLRGRIASATRSHTIAPRHIAPTLKITAKITKLAVLLLRGTVISRLSQIVTIFVQLSAVLGWEFSVMMLGVLWRIMRLQLEIFAS